MLTRGIADPVSVCNILFFHKNKTLCALIVPIIIVSRDRPSSSMSVHYLPFCLLEVFF